MITLLYSGNLGLGQELGSVLHALSRLNGDHNLKFLIVSSGKGVTETKRLAEDLKLANVEFRPPVSLLELPELLAAGDIHLICQKNGTEGLLVPSKIYGTLACGRPSIFIGPANCEVSRILSDSKSGFVVEAGDVEGTFNALSRLVSSIVLRLEMGTNAKKFYESNFGRKRSVFKIVGIINRITGQDGQMIEQKKEIRR